MHKKPNIILINCDDLGYGDLGCYGSTRNDTPHLDRLAGEGLKFTNFYMASPVCSASRAAMMTGCVPNRIGFHKHQVLFPGQGNGLNPSEKTVARYLKEAGYATKLVGKWHCGDQPGFLPTDHGFDEYFGIPFSNDMGRQAGRDAFPPLPLMRNNRVLQEQPDQRGLTEQYTRECLDFIDTNRDSPFFLYFAHMYVHVPIFVPKHFMERSRNGGYGGAVACIDWSTGAIVDRLESLGLLENTLIVFTSDNGSRARDEGGSNGPLRGTKATTWEGGQRVPCLMHWPAKIAPGREVHSVYRSIDLLPSFCALAGVGLDEEREIDGVDMSRLLCEDIELHPENEVYYYYQEKLCAYRRGDWKYHVNYCSPGHLPAPPDKPTLFNLREDPGEQQDWSDDFPEIVQQMEKRIEEIRQMFGDSEVGIEGKACRPSGFVESAKPLTEYDENHPYMVASYDLADMPTMAG